MLDKPWHTQVLIQIALFLKELYPRNSRAWLESRLSLLSGQLHEIVGNSGFWPVQKTVELILEQTCRDAYDEAEKRYLLDPREIFKGISYALSQDFGEVFGPGQEAVYVRARFLADLIAACVLDAYCQALRWGDLTRSERKLAEAVADQFLRLEAAEAIDTSALRGPDSRNSGDPLEPRLRVFMNTLIRNGGDLPRCLQQSVPEAPEVMPMAPSDGFDA